MFELVLAMMHAAIFGGIFFRAWGTDDRQERISLYLYAFFSLSMSITFITKIAEKIT